MLCSAATAAASGALQAPLHVLSHQEQGLIQLGDAKSARHFSTHAVNCFLQMLLETVHRREALQHTSAKPMPCRLYVELDLCLRGCGLMHPILHCVASLNALQQAEVCQEAGSLALQLHYLTPSRGVYAVEAVLITHSMCIMPP